MESKIYTKKGDGGQTSLFTGGKVPKTNIRIQAYGSVDELNSAIGLARSFSQHPSVKQLLFQIQNKVMNVASLLATKEPPVPDLNRRYPRIYEEDVVGLEKCIDYFDNALPTLTNFIVPGENTAGAALDVARTTCRRAERAVVYLMQTEEVDPVLQKFLNRLSDLLFVLERTEYYHQGGNDRLWSK